LKLIVAKRRGRPEEEEESKPHEVGPADMPLIARGGGLEVLKHVREQGCGVRLEMLKWMAEWGCE